MRLPNKGKSSGKKDENNGYLWLNVNSYPCDSAFAESDENLPKKLKQDLVDYEVYSMSPQLAHEIDQVTDTIITLLQALID